MNFLSSIVFEVSSFLDAISDLLKILYPTIVLFVKTSGLNFFLNNYKSLEEI